MIFRKILNLFNAKFFRKPVIRKQDIKVCKKTFVKLIFNNEIIFTMLFFALQYDLCTC